MEINISAKIKLVDGGTESYTRSNVAYVTVARLPPDSHEDLVKSVPPTPSFVNAPGAEPSTGGTQRELPLTGALFLDTKAVGSSYEPLEEFGPLIAEDLQRRGVKLAAYQTASAELSFQFPEGRQGYYLTRPGEGASCDPRDEGQDTTSCLSLDLWAGKTGQPLRRIGEVTGIGHSPAGLANAEKQALRMAIADLAGSVVSTLVGLEKGAQGTDQIKTDQLKGDGSE